MPGDTFETMRKVCQAATPSEQARQTACMSEFRPHGCDLEGVWVWMAMEFDRCVAAMTFRHINLATSDEKELIFTFR